MTAFILKQLRKEQKGFTLIELLAVIVILGVIAAIAVPLIGKVISNSKKDSDIATAGQIYQASRLYITAELGGTAPTTPITLGTLITNGYLTALSLPSTKEPLSLTSTTVTYSTTPATDTAAAISTLTNVIMTTSASTYTCGGGDVIAGKGSCTKAP